LAPGTVLRHLNGRNLRVSGEEPELPEPVKDLVRYPHGDAVYCSPCFTVVLGRLRCVGIAPADEVTVSDGTRLAEGTVL
jgi:hypothetical protein